MVTVAVTGHRLEKLGGYSEAVDLRLTKFAADTLARLPQEGLVVITGMALGWDLAVAEACAKGGIQYIAAIPCDDQESLWEARSQLRYHTLVLKAKEIVIVSPGPYAAWKMAARNKWMVDKADGVIALWDGSKGGTANAVHYADSVGKPIANEWRQWVRYFGQGGS